jgi:hypothetical protein
MSFECFFYSSREKKKEAGSNTEHKKKRVNRTDQSRKKRNRNTVRTSRITLKREILIEDEKWEQRKEEEKEKTKKTKIFFFIDLRMWLVLPSFGILHHHHH